MNDKVTKILAFIALGVMAIFTVTLVLSFIGIGGWYVTGIVIGSGLIAVALFIVFKVRMRKSADERAADREKKAAELKKIDDLIDPDEKQ